MCFMVIRSIGRCDMCERSLRFSLSPIPRLNATMVAVAYVFYGCKIERNESYMKKLFLTWSNHTPIVVEEVIIRVMTLDRISQSDDELRVWLDFSNDLRGRDGGGVKAAVGFLGGPPGVVRGRGGEGERKRGGRIKECCGKGGKRGGGRLVGC